MDERWFASLGTLWLEWMEYAAELLYYDEHYSVFMRRFLRSNKEERERLSKIIVHHIRRERSTEIEGIFAKIKPPSTDRLPKDWRHRLRCLWPINSTLGAGYEVRLLKDIERGGFISQE